MKKYFKGFLFGVVGVVFIIITWVGFYSFSPLEVMISSLKKEGIKLAAVILSHNFKSTDEIKSNYDSSRNKVKILIVPGHEPNYGGSEFGNLKEREMTLELGEELQEILEENNNYEVFITRTKEGWSPYFENYFNEESKKIVEWTKASKDEFSNLVSIGDVTQTISSVAHNTAPENVALRLYGFIKWSNENDIDIMLHIHFNDNPRSNTKNAGKYSGFAVYVPASQYGNSTTTKMIANSVFNSLKKNNQVSDLPGESMGIIDEPELIAIGANNTSDAASLLIEYGYIYEPRFQDSNNRSSIIKNLARETYLGLQDFMKDK